MSLYDFNPSAKALKTKTIDSWAAEAIAAGTVYGSAVEVPRGACNISFSSELTLLDRSTADETYTVKVQHRNDPSHSWVDVPGLTFTTVSATTGYEQLPTAANAPGVRLKKYVRGAMTTVGTTPIATGTLRMAYTNRGPGKVADHGIRS
jgi:hypothetical protein